MLSIYNSLIIKQPVFLYAVTIFEQLYEYNNGTDFYN